MDCRCKLSDWILKKDSKRPLYIPFGFELGIIADGPGEKCPCYICNVAGLSGGRLKAYIARHSGSKESSMRCNTCFGQVKISEIHTCDRGKQSLIDNLKVALPLKTRQQLALETIRETEEQLGGAGDSAAIQLQSHRGGKPTVITLGRKAPPPPGASFLDSEGIKSLQLKHNLNATQTRGLLADYRSLNGKSSVEPYYWENFLQSKEHLKGFYSAELVDFVIPAEWCISFGFCPNNPPPQKKKKITYLP